MNYDDLIIVFSNYNGNRICNDLTTPRVSVLLESFKKRVPYHDKLNALLLDNNSKDGSHEILKSHESSKWRYCRKDREDYYLGTMYHLLNDFRKQYKYMMIVDNDQYFYRENFLDTAMQLLKIPGVINVQINEVTVGDFIDHRKTEDGIVGVFDKVWYENDEIVLRSAMWPKKKSSWFTCGSKKKGMGFIRAKGRPSKRACWLAYGYFNCIVNIEAMLCIFDNTALHPPYKSNKDRLALFSSSVYEAGRTLHLGHGASINVGFRNHVPSNFSVKSLMSSYDSYSARHLRLENGYSYYLKTNNLLPIEIAIKEIKNA